jgi:S-(hydroxymethyl)glutathione dehydrogenase/alcohol dehydrogenase
MPVVLGHESAGTVVSVGEGVSSTVARRPGGAVLGPAVRRVLVLRQGEPWLCERSERRGDPAVRHGRRAGRLPGPVDRRLRRADRRVGAAVLPVPDAVPLEHAALVGCAVMTGVGAVLNTAAVREGQSVLVVGLGGVGLSVVQGARLAGAGQVIVVDRSPTSSSSPARSAPPTCSRPAASSPSRSAGSPAGAGADHAFDCVGLAETIRSSWASTRRGGVTTVVGIGGKDTQVSFSPLELFHFARTLQGCVYGSTDPLSDIPKVLAHAAEGRLDLGALISGTVGLDGIDDAFADMAAGTGARTLVVP